MTSRFSLRLSSRRRLSNSSHGSASSVSTISQQRNPKQENYSAEEEEIEREINEKVLQVVANEGHGNSFGLHWREIALNQRSTLKSKLSYMSLHDTDSGTRSKIDDSYETDVSDGEGNHTRYSLESSKSATLGRDPSTPSIIVRKSSARKLDPFSDTVPMLSGWLASLSRQVALPGQQGMKMIENDRRVLVIDDDNQALHITTSEQLKKAKTIPFQNIENVRIHKVDGMCFMAIHVNLKRRIGSQKVYYFKSVRNQMPYRPNYGQEKVVQWICALRYRAGIYDAQRVESSEKMAFGSKSQVINSVHSEANGVQHLNGVDADPDDSYIGMISSGISNTAQNFVNGIREVGNISSAVIFDMFGIAEETEEDL